MSKSQKSTIFQYFQPSVTQFILQSVSFSVIAVELLKITYLHRNQPLAPASEILNPLQIEVLIAGARNKPPRILTVAWAIESIAYLGGYLEHRHTTPIGIQVLWRGFLKLHDLCQGWLLAKSTYREK